MMARPKRRTRAGLAFAVERKSAMAVRQNIGGVIGLECKSRHLRDQTGLCRLLRQTTRECLLDIGVGAAGLNCEYQAASYIHCMLGVEGCRNGPSALLTRGARAIL